MNTATPGPSIGPATPAKPAEPTASSPGALRWPTLREALTLRCPLCWQAAMFRSPLHMNAQCERCGHAYDRGHGYFLGAMYFSYTLVVLFEAALVTGLRLGGLSWASTLAIAVATVFAVGPLLAFPASRWLWVTVERRFLQGNNDDALRAENDRRRAARNSGVATEAP